MIKKSKRRSESVPLPPAPDPVNERPEGMSYEDYKKLRAERNKALKERRAGFILHEGKWQAPPRVKTF